MQHFNSLGNEYFKFIQEANELHMTARAKYLQLTKLLKSKGVKFKDIKNFLLNEAKRSGLYRKTTYNAKIGTMDYPKTSSLKGKGWYTALSNYMSWLTRNYKDYNVEKPKVTKDDSKKSKVVTRKNSTGDVVSAEVISKDGVKETKTIEAITSELSTSQITTILNENWGILGEYCKANGAGQEFQNLITKLGVTV